MFPKRAEILELCNTDPEVIITLIETFETRITHLEARIAELEARQNQNSKNSSKPPSTDTYTRPQSPRKKGERSPGGQKEHKGHTLTKVDVPDEIIVHTVPICEEVEHRWNQKCQ